MGRRWTQLHPQVEGFEPRTMLSAGMGGAASRAVAVARATSGFISLDGTFHGRYVVVSSLPDGGATFRAKGSGHLHGIGRASLKGTFTSVGFIAQGVAQGGITLVRPGDRIALELTSPVEHGGPTELPSVFSVGITGASGKFRGDHGFGSATLTMAPGQASVGLRPGERGTFSLVLSPKAIPL
jgi:hypothetical protein